MIKENIKINLPTVAYTRFKNHTYRAQSETNGNVGTSERTGGITKNYNASGNLHSITDSKGVTRDLSGNPVSDPYGE